MTKARIIATVDGAELPITLEQARAQCRVDSTDEDALIETFVGVAVQAAADRMQRSLVPTRWRGTLDSFPAAIELPHPPIMSVESVKYIDANGTQQTLDPQDYLVDSVSEPGYLVPTVARTWPATQGRINAVEVEYTAGYAAGAVPLPIQQWILLAVGDLYGNRSRSAEKPSVPQNFADELLSHYIIWSL